MKKILILVLSNLKHDARVMRQINFLKDQYQLTVCCLDIAPTKEYNVVIIQPLKLTFLKRVFLASLLFLKRFSFAYDFLFPYKQFLKDQLKDEQFDLIIANDIETLPLAFQLKGVNSKVLFDAHEYAPKHFENKFWWRVFFQPFNTFLCRKYIPKTHGMITIGTGIANEYEKQFGVKPVVLTNASPFYPLQPIERTDSLIRIVHTGIVNPSRKIELIIAIMDHLPENFTLDLFLLIPPFSSNQTKAYLEKLKTLAAANGRIKFPTPVASDKIVALLQEYDMGIILAPPINFNYANGLPNKLYDYIQARLAVITGPTPEIANIVNSYDLGVVSDNFLPQSFAAKIGALNKENVHQMKKQSHKAAQEHNSEKNRIILRDLVASILAEEKTVDGRNSQKVGSKL